MRRFLILLALLVFGAVAQSSTAGASEKRLALVIGNDSYRGKSLVTPVNDAALIAQILQASGFEVTGLANLNEPMLRRSFGDFLDRVKNAGPDAVVVVYFAGFGLQCDGQNYLLPIDAEISEASDVFRHALSLSEQTRSLAALHVKAIFIVIDAARASPFLVSGRSPASGLAWMEPEPNMLVAFNAAPGTVAPDDRDRYGAYAIALAEMIREGGLTPEALFDRVRLRVNELTKGAQVPWDAANIPARLEFFERAAGAPQSPDAPERTAWMRSQPMRKLGPDDAYWTALLRDTFEGYAEFLAEYWNDPMAKSVQALLAARRETITWRRSNQADIPDAYWTYLERYPHGPHVADAERLLTRLGAAIAPPAQFRRLDYDVPPPLPDEFAFIERPVLRLDDPAFAFAPPKPLPAYFLKAPPSELQTLAQPVAASGDHALPTLPLLSSRISIPAGPPDRLVTGQVDRARGNDQSNGPGRREGQGGAGLRSGAAVVASKPVANPNVQSSLLPSGSNNPSSPAVPAAQPVPGRQAEGASPRLPAWASLLPAGNRGPLRLDGPPLAASTGTGVPLFVSAALAPVASPVRRTLGRTPLAHARPVRPEQPASAAARGSPHAVVTGSFAPARPPTLAAVGAPNAGRVRKPSSPVNGLTTSSIATPGTRPAPLSQVGTGAQGQTSRTPGQATQSTPLAGGHAAPVGGRPDGNGPKPAAGVAPIPKAADQAAQHAARKKKVEPPLASNAERPSEVPAQQPRNNPCTVSNGRLSCEDNR